jgi:hypothetical protein
VQVTGDRSAVLFHVRVASVRAMPCHFRGTLTIRLVDENLHGVTGRRPPPLFRVRNNGAAVTLDGDLPEGTAGSGVLSVTWKWTNWCRDRSVRAEVVGPGGAVEELPLRRLRAAPTARRRRSSCRSVADAGSGGPLRRAALDARFGALWLGQHRPAGRVGPPVVCHQSGAEHQQPRHLTRRGSSGLVCWIWMVRVEGNGTMER